MSLPIKSRQNLTRCAACRAHIVAADAPSATECPFCGANLHRDRGARWLPSGRGALLAASLIGFSASACGGGQPAEDDSNSSVSSGDEPVASDEPTGDDGSGDDQYDPDPADDGAGIAEYGVAADEYEEEPADSPAPMARYGMAPSQR